MQETEKKLSGVLYERGINDKTFAVIRSKGDQALFRLSTATLKRKMNIPASRPLADFLPTISIKAKDFAAELTSVNVQAKDLQNETMITQEHIDNNAAVRRILLERGVIPEDLPAEEDVKIFLCLKTSSRIYEPFPSEQQSDAVFINPAAFGTKIPLIPLYLKIESQS